MTDEEVNNYKLKFKDMNNVMVFVTEKNDIESYFMNSNHVNYLYPNIDINKLKILYDESISENKEASIIKMINSRTNIELVAARDGNKNINPGEISKYCNEEYSKNPENCFYGKSVLGTFIAKIQKEISTNPKLFQPSNYLIINEIKQYLE